MPRSSVTLPTLVAALLFLSAGCQMFPDRFRPLPEASLENPVMEVMCLWQPGEGTGLDGLPTRGFAGQVLFLSAGSTEPVKVDGDIRIYVFDDQGTIDEQSRPIHEFNFPAEVWDTYFHRTNLGGTYQIFVPYTRKGAHHAECTLRVRYTPRQGAPVYSRMAHVPLTGRRPDPSETPDVSPSQQQSIDAARLEVAAAAPEPNGVIQISHETVTPEPVEATSLTMPPAGRQKDVARMKRSVLHALAEAESHTTAPADEPQDESSASATVSRRYHLLSDSPPGDSTPADAPAKRSSTGASEPAGTPPSRPQRTTSHKPHPLGDMAADSL